MTGHTIIIKTLWDNPEAILDALDVAPWGEHQYVVRLHPMTTDEYMEFLAEQEEPDEIDEDPPVPE